MKLSKLYALICIFFFLFFKSYSYEFLYPVAKIEHEGKTKIYVIYQKSIAHLELWLWDPDTKNCFQGLRSTYTPASLQVLPSNNGFSFIDDGRIRIKNFSKRSPKTVDIYEPIYDFSQVHWIDDDNFYISAKKDGNSSIFHLNTAGLIKSVLQDLDCDFIYPQKVGNMLFYIERKLNSEYKKKRFSYKIAMTEYPVYQNYMQNFISNLEKCDFEEKAKKIEDQSLISEKKKTYIANFNSTPIAFLKMISENEGFFLEHPEDVDRHEKTITFNYFHMKKLGANWKCEIIFSFSIPSFLILDWANFRLYESILPLLPRYHEGKIYYTNYLPSKCQNLDIFCYDMFSKVSERKTFGPKGSLFVSPVFFDKGKIFYGGQMDELSGSLPKMWISDQGDMRIDLPYLIY